MSQAILLSEVSKSYPGGSRAVAEASLEVAEGTLLALLGPSGCGKTTTLRLIAGLERPDSGVIAVGGRSVAGPTAWVPPEQRRVGLVFQDGALFPHLNVAANISFALVGRQRSQQLARVRELLTLVGLEGLESRFPHQLSGGQQQRVALARALAPEPAVVLLDEPFANLDVALRVELREEVARILRAAGATAVLVTHDRQEALSLADRVALMLDGRIAQHGTPRELYSRPASRAVAGFIGEANWLAGEADGQRARSALGPLVLLSPASGPVELLIRPEQLAVQPDPNSPWKLGGLRFFGHDQLAALYCAGHPPLHARLSATEALEPGLPVAVSVRGPVHAFPRSRELE